MCEKCVDLVKKYYPELEEEEYGHLLMSATAFPFGDPEHIEKQLIELRANTDGSLTGAIVYADQQLQEEMQTMHDEELKSAQSP